MAINTYLLTIESKKTNEANKKNRDRIIDTESILIVVHVKWGVIEWMKR